MNDHETAAILLTGLGATAFTDLWVLVRERVFGISRPNYGLVGRWIAHMARGRFHHDSIAAARPVRAERALGWITHYAIGIAFALLLAAIAGAPWFRNPTALPAILVGIGTVAAPFFIMQPAMGGGFAASRTPRPASARFQSLLMHTMFGLGLYLAARIVSSVSQGE